MIKPTDDTIEVKLMDQDITLDDTVGKCYINISHDIVDEGFPQHKGYKLMHKDGVLWGGSMRKTGVVVLSFVPCVGMPEHLKQHLEEKHPMEHETRERRRSSMMG